MELILDKTLLVYDLETSGLTPFDQVLEYAAIRLNAHTLEEIDREHIQVAWRRDMIPSADAFLVHQIPLHGRSRVSEAQGIVSIHQSLNAQNTISGGYNTLGFDDEMLRFSFYRNLLTPYTHQYANGCGRFDLLPIVVFYYLYAPDVIKWPKKDDGRPSFKLEDLNRENNWVQGRAHEAMVDVEATVALAKHLRLNLPMWQYLMGYYDRVEDQKRLGALMQQPEPYKGVGIMVSLRFGYAQEYQAPVINIGAHHLYKNQSVFLRLDQQIDLSEQGLEKLVIKKKAGEPGFVLPYSDKYSARLPGHIKELVEENLKTLSSEDVQTLLQHCRHLAPEQREYVDLDARLYLQGFLSKEEQSWCEQFHLAQENAKSELLNSVTSDSLKEQALRFLWRTQPEQIPHELEDQAVSSIKKFVCSAKDFRGNPFLRISEARIKLDEALKNSPPEHLKAGLEQMHAHLDQLQEELSLA